MVKTLPRDISNVVAASREYLGVDYTKVPCLRRKALLEAIGKIEKLEKEVELIESK